MSKRDSSANPPARYQIPVLHAYRAFLADGGLMSCGADAPEQIGLTAIYIDRIAASDHRSDADAQLDLCDAEALHHGSA